VRRVRRRLLRWLNPMARRRSMSELGAPLSRRFRLEGGRTPGVRQRHEHGRQLSLGLVEQRLRPQVLAA